MTFAPLSTMRSAGSMSNDFEVKDSGAREQHDTGAQRDVQEGKPRPDLMSPFAMERVGYVFARGAEKYEERNWEKGMPLSRYLASAERHLMQFKQGDTDEDHLAQAVWNLCAILHHQEVGPPGLDDLPHYERLTKPIQNPAFESSNSGWIDTGPAPEIDMGRLRGH